MLDQKYWHVKRNMLGGSVNTDICSLPLVFLFSSITTDTITASNSTPTVIASAVTACTDRL